MGHSSDYFNKIDEAFDGLSSLIQTLNETSNREIASLSHRERFLIAALEKMRVVRNSGSHSSSRPRENPTPPTGEGVDQPDENDPEAEVHDSGS